MLFVRHNVVLRIWVYVRWRTCYLDGRHSTRTNTSWSGSSNHPSNWDIQHTIKVSLKLHYILLYPRLIMLILLQMHRSWIVCLWGSYGSTAQRTNLFCITSCLIEFCGRTFNNLNDCPSPIIGDSWRSLHVALKASPLTIPTACIHIEDTKVQCIKRAFQNEECYSVIVIERTRTLIYVLY